MSKKTKISMTLEQLSSLFGVLHEKWKTAKLQGDRVPKEEIELMVDLAMALSHRHSRGQYKSADLPKGWWVWVGHGCEPGLHMWKHLGMPRRTIWYFDSHAGEIPAAVIDLSGGWPTVHVNMQAPQRLIDKAREFVKGKGSTWSVREWESHEKFPPRFYTQDF